MITETGIGNNHHQPSLRKRLFPYLIMLLIAIAVYAPGIFVPGGFFNYGDFSFPFNPEKRWITSFSILDYTVVPERAPYYQGYLPALTIILGLNAIGIPLWLLNHLLLISAGFAASASIYHLSKTLLNTNDSMIPAMLGGAFAVLNPTFVYHDPLLEISYAAIFFFLSIFILGFRNPSMRRYYILVPIASLLMVWSPLSFLIGITIVSAYFALYHIIQLKSPSKNRIIYLVALSAGTFAINLFWLGVPIFLQYTGIDIASAYTSPVSGNEGLNIIKQTSSASTLGGSLTLSFNNCVWCNLFYNDPSIGIIRVLVSFVPIILGIWALTYLRSGINLKIFLFFWIAFMVLSVGMHYPLTGKLYEFLWTNMPGFSGLRDTNQIYYTMAFVVATILSLGSYYFISQFKSHWKTIIVIILSAMIVSNGLVLFLYGPERNFAAHAQPFFIPSDYPMLKERLSIDEDSGYRALILPVSGGGVNYKWNPVKKPAMNNIILDYLPVPAVAVATIDLKDNVKYGRFLDLGINLLNAKETLDSASKILGSMGVKYIIVQKDLEGINLDIQAATYSENVSARADLFEKMEGFTNIDVFMLKKNLVPPLRFATIDATNNSGETLVPAEYLTTNPPGFIAMTDNNAFIETSSSDLHNLDSNFGILLWVKFPNEPAPADILSSTTTVQRLQGGVMQPQPIYSIKVDESGIVTFTLLGSKEDITINSEPVPFDSWHMIFVGSDENQISLVIDDRYTSTVPRNERQNTPAYSRNTGIILGKTDAFENVGARGFMYSKLFIFVEKPPQNQLTNTFKRGPEEIPAVSTQTLASWNFQSPARDSAVSGYDVSTTGIEYVIGTVHYVPLKSFVSDEKSFSIIDADFDRAIQTSDFRLSSLQYTLNVNASRGGMVILNSDYDPNWTLTFADGRTVSSTLMSREWNVWYINDFTEPFTITYRYKDIVLYSMLTSAILFGAFVVTVLRIRPRAAETLDDGAIIGHLKEMK